MDRFCECEIIGAVARDIKSTCMQCGGIDAYKKSKQKMVKNSSNLDSDEHEIPYPEGCKLCNVATGCDGSC